MVTDEEVDEQEEEPAEKSYVLLPMCKLLVFSCKETDGKKDRR